MKLKLIAVLSFIVFGLAGCAADYKTSNTNNTSAPATTANANNTNAPATAQNNPNIIEANADPTDKTGGTKEGCKCSAVGMTCNNKEGEKGCCGGKDGACSSMKEGDAKCCSMEKGGACCSASKTAMADHKDMPKGKSGSD
jgi:hypothetical protein